MQLRQGLADKGVTALCEDREGTLWVGTYAGLNRFVGGRFVTELNSKGERFDFVKGQSG